MGRGIFDWIKPTRGVSRYEFAWRIPRWWVSLPRSLGKWSNLMSIFFKGLKPASRFIQHLVLCCSCCFSLDFFSSYVSVVNKIEDIERKHRFHTKNLRLLVTPCVCLVGNVSRILPWDSWPWTTTIWLKYFVPTTTKFGKSKTHISHINQIPRQVS